MTLDSQEMRLTNRHLHPALCQTPNRMIHADKPSLATERTAGRCDFHKTLRNASDCCPHYLTVKKTFVSTTD